MSDKDKNVKKDPVEKMVKATAETAETPCKFKANWKVIAGIFVVVIILLNTFWTMTESKISQSVTEAMGSITVADEMESFRTGFKEEMESFKTEIKNEAESFRTEFKSDFADLEARVAETEKGSIDVDVVKADIAAIKAAGEIFERKLNALIKAEEGKLALLEQDVVNQKSYVDELKGLLEGGR